MLNRFRFSFWPVVVTLTAFTLLCKLGFWQLQRAEEKQLWLTQFNTLSAVSVEQLQTHNRDNSLGLLNGQTVELSGKVLADYMMFLDNRVYQGQTGYKVLAPVQLDGFEQLLLVDFGWLAGPRSREQLPNYELPQDVKLMATIKSTELDSFMLESQPLTSVWPQRVQAVSEVLTHPWQPAIMPMIIFAESGQLPGLIQTYKPVVMLPEKHRAYAVQWFLLAMASVIIFLFASRSKPAADIDK